MKGKVTIMLMRDVVVALCDWDCHSVLLEVWRSLRIWDIWERRIYDKNV